MLIVTQIKERMIETIARILADAARDNSELQDIYRTVATWENATTIDDSEDWYDILTTITDEFTESK